MPKHIENHKWPEVKRIEAVTSYLVLGNAALVEMATGVPQGTVRQWKTQPWWNELVEQVQSESDQALDSKLSSRVDRILDLVQDRIDNGDFLYDPRTGEFIRKPVSLRDGWKAGKEMVDVRMALRKNRVQSVDQEAVQDILKNLAAEFATMAKKKVREKIDGQEPELQVGVRELPREAGADQEPVGTEPSASDPSQSGLGPQG